METHTKDHTKTRDWNEWLRGEGKRMHLACGACNPGGIGSPMKAYCGATLLYAETRAGAPLPDDCEMCAQLAFPVRPCGPGCKRS